MFVLTFPHYSFVVMLINQDVMYKPNFASLAVLPFQNTNFYKAL